MAHRLHHGPRDKAVVTMLAQTGIGTCPSLRWGEKGKKRISDSFVYAHVCFSSVDGDLGDLDGVGVDLFKVVDGSVGV